jgi:hypothetical protein
MSAAGISAIEVITVTLTIGHISDVVQERAEQTLVTRVGHPSPAALSGHYLHLGSVPTASRAGRTEVP